jgi:hypothetical protein
MTLVRALESGNGRLTRLLFESETEDILRIVTEAAARCVHPHKGRKGNRSTRRRSWR